MDKAPLYQATGEAEMTNEVVEAWHFLREDRCLGFDDGRAVRPGEWLACTGEPALCENGMHGSIRALDAFHYAPGPVVCRVQLRGDIFRGDDQLVARERRVIWMADATETLRAFARQCALDVIHLWDAPEVVHRYLETGDESLRSATEGAAWNAARAAAWNAAWAACAAWNAARAAAWNAAWNATEGAAWNAARAAAWAAARHAARNWQNARLEQMLWDGARTFKL